MSRVRNDSGFSIVEALVALAVFAMAGVALVQLQAHSLSTFSEVETRAIANLAAQNRLTEIVAARARPELGVREEEIRFAGRAWLMSVTIAGTPDAETRRVSVSVREPGAGLPSAMAHAFVTAPGVS
jgi:general secretion pathway protein I